MSNESPIDHSTANGITTVFPYSFLIVDEDDIQVYLDNALASASLYSVSGVGADAGGNVTFLSAPGNGVVVTRVRNVRLTRLVDYQDAGDFRASTVDGDFNRIWQVLQQQSLAAARSIHVAISDSTATEDLQLPAPAARAGLFLGFDAGGRAVALLGTGADSALRTDLATADDGKGAELVAFEDLIVTVPAFLKTTSDIINGERVSSMRWIATAAERAAIIDGSTTTDHTDVLNQMFQDMKTSKKANLLLHPGLYNSERLVICSDIKVSAYGSTIKALSSLLVTDPLMFNENFDGTDENIEWRGGTFQGNATTGRAELVGFGRVDRLKIVDLHVTGNDGIGLALGGCTNFLLDNIEIDDTGKAAVTAEGGAALWIGTYGLVYPARHGVIRNPYIHDCEWSGMYNTGTAAHYNNDIQLIAPKIINVKEAGIFGAYFSSFHVVAPHIENIAKKNISGSGIELGGIEFSIVGGLITDCAASCIALTDCQGGTIGNGLITRNARRDAVSFATGGHIAIITTQVFPNQPRWLTIEGHHALDVSSPSYCAVEIGNVGDAVLNTIIQNNNYSGTVFTAGDPIQIGAGKWGSGSYRRNNAGSWDFDGGISADRGDASVTLNVGIDEEVQLFETTLTANRALTLATGTAYKGAKFRIVRTGLGAFTIDVGGLKTMPSATAAWCEVVFNGSAWKLAGYGTL